MSKIDDQKIGAHFPIFRSYHSTKIFSIRWFHGNKKTGSQTFPGTSTLQDYQFLPWNLAGLAWYHPATGIHIKW